MARQVLKQIVSEVGKDRQTPAGYQDFLLQLAGPVAIQSILTVSVPASRSDKQVSKM